MQRKTEVGNEITSSTALWESIPEQVVSRMGWGGGIVSEADAFGKVKGYADGDTAIGMVGLSVAMDTS